VFRLDEGLKVYFHREPVDFRLSIDGLSTRCSLRCRSTFCWSRSRP
jgi:hypothetical protein